MTGSCSFLAMQSRPRILCIHPCGLQLASSLSINNALYSGVIRHGRPAFARENSHFSIHKSRQSTWDSWHCRRTGAEAQSDGAERAAAVSRSGPEDPAGVYCKLTPLRNRLYFTAHTNRL